MSPTRNRSFLVIAVLLLLVATLDADTLVLRDGRRIQGELLSYQNGYIEFQEAVYGARPVRVSRDTITSIEFGRVDRNDRTDRNEPPAGRGGGRPRGLREKQLMVPANVAWTDTGIEVSAGQNVYFEAQGEIRWGPGRRANPSGEQNSPNNPARPMPNRPGASLIGKVGDSSDLFYVGDESGAFRMRSSGKLFLGINDDGLQDNTGYFRVIVYY